MTPDNHYYGHDVVLRRYCGVRLPLPLAGRLQHGWMPGPGTHAQQMRAGYPKFLWSRRNLEASQAAGYTALHPIGAPFLYLPEPPPIAPRPRSLLAFPFHSTHRLDARGNAALYAQMLEELRRDFATITVCMYHVDFDRPERRKIFESHGFEIVTAGPRDGNPEFLPRLQRFILSHEAVTSNRIATATFYALACGRPFFVRGPMMGVDTEPDPTGAAFAEWAAREFPKLAWERFDGRPDKALGERELGLEFKRPPDELRELLGLRLRSLPRVGWNFARHVVHFTRLRLEGVPRPR